MTATLDPPLIITPRTLDALRPYLAADVADQLGELIRRFFAEHVAPLYARSESDFDTTLLRALPRSAQPRMEMVFAFLRAVDPAQCGSAFRDAFDLMQNSLGSEGWRLGDASDALRIALDQLVELVPRSPPPHGDVGPAVPPDLGAGHLQEVPPELREGLESVLFRATELDLCILGPLAYLQGDLPAADPSRVGRGCELAAVTASMVCSRYQVMSGPDLTSAERGELLHALAGSWPSSDDEERALERVYEDRTGDR